MEFYEALYRYNERSGTKFFTQAYIAKRLGISRQALWQLTYHGGQKGLGKYRDKLKEILPEDLFNTIDFPKYKHLSENGRVGKKYLEHKEKTTLSNVEKSRLEKVRWVVTKGFYSKVMNGGLITIFRYNKLMKQIEEAEKWVKDKENMKNDKMVDQENDPIMEEQEE